LANPATVSAILLVLISAFPSTPDNPPTPRGRWNTGHAHVASSTTTFDTHSVLRTVVAARAVKRARSGGWGGGRDRGW
jgi:hypothetical protein